MLSASLTGAASSRSMRPLFEEEIGARNRGAAAAHLLVKRLARRGQAVEHQGGATKDGAGMAVVGAHPVSGIGGASGFEADAERGGFVLGVPVEGVVVAIAAEVQETSGCGEKVEGGFGVVRACLRRRGDFLGPALLPLQMTQQKEPLGELVIAKAAGAFLDVGFQMEDRVAVFGVARARHLGELLGDGAPFAEQQCGKHFGLKAAIECAVSDEEAAVESGDDEFEIVRVSAFAFLQGAHGGAYAQADVP